MFKIVFEFWLFCYWVLGVSFVICLINFLCKCCFFFLLRCVFWVLVKMNKFFVCLFMVVILVVCKFKLSLVKVVLMVVSSFGVFSVMNFIKVCFLFLVGRKLIWVLILKCCKLWGMCFVFCVVGWLFFSICIRWWISVWWWFFLMVCLFWLSIMKVLSI